jgi:hypothetical protein
MEARLALARRVGHLQQEWQYLGQASHSHPPDAAEVFARLAATPWLERVERVGPGDVVAL